MRSRLPSRLTERTHVDIACTQRTASGIIAVRSNTSANVTTRRSRARRGGRRRAERDAIAQGSAAVVPGPARPVTVLSRACRSSRIRWSNRKSSLDSQLLVYGSSCECCSSATPSARRITPKALTRWMRLTRSCQCSVLRNVARATNASSRTAATRGSAGLQPRATATARRGNDHFGFGRVSLRMTMRILPIICLASSGNQMCWIT